MSDYEQPTIYKTVPTTLSNNTMTQEIKPLSEDEVKLLFAMGPVVMIGGGIDISRIIATIRQLQEENKRWQSLQASTQEKWNNAIDKLILKNSEIEKLREALKRLADCDWVIGSGSV